MTGDSLSTKLLTNSIQKLYQRLAKQDHIPPVMGIVEVGILRYQYCLTHFL